MAVIKRAVGSVARRLERPELIGAIDSGAARALREEIALRAVMSAVLGRDSVYVDIGANDGQLLTHAVRAAPEGQHIAFEPIAEHATRVRAAFPGVDCRALAVGDVPGFSSFCHFRTMSGWSGLQRRPEVSDKAGQPETIEVRVVRLDDELRGVTPRLIKIDVEGGELAVLRGAREVLATARPLLIFEHEPQAAALYGATSLEVWGLLAGAGYRVFSIGGEGPFARPDEAPASINWFASPA